MAINDVGSVAGGMVNAAGEGRAFLYSSGLTYDLGALSGGSWSVGYGVNASDQVTGSSDDAFGRFRAFTWSSGSGSSSASRKPSEWRS